MSIQNFIKGNTEDYIWEQISRQFAQNPDPLEYAAAIQQGNQQVVLTIDIDLGGGFESGYETTSFTAPLPAATDFRFAIHEQHFTDEIGKFFGMQDVETGYREFDKRLIIKTNDELRVKGIFAEPATRAVFESLDNFTFGITTHHISAVNEKTPFLELVIESGITNPAKLRTLYHAFFSILTVINPVA